LESNRVESAGRRKKGQLLVQSVERALAILEVLAEKGYPMSLTEIRDEVGLNISTVHRLLSTLMAHDFVQQEPSSNHYKLGLKTFRIGNAALYQFDIRAIARPHLRKLVEHCNETANLVVWDQGEVVYVDQVESTNIMKMIARIGGRGPAHSTAAGKILLSSFPPDELKQILSRLNLRRLTSKTIVEPDELLEELKKVRERGYALDLGGTEDHVICVAAPIRDYEGKTVAAISVSGPSVRITTEYLEKELVPLVKRVAGEISREIGYLGQPAEGLADEKQRKCI